MPCCGSVDGCGARAVSRKTPIYFIILNGDPLLFSDIVQSFILIRGQQCNDDVHQNSD